MFKCAYRNVAGQSYSTNGYYEMPKPEYLIRKADHQVRNLQIQATGPSDLRDILTIILTKSKFYFPQAMCLSISCDLIISSYFSGLVGCFP